MRKNSGRWNILDGQISFGIWVIVMGIAAILGLVTDFISINELRRNGPRFWLLAGIAVCATFLISALIYWFRIKFLPTPAAEIQEREIEDDPDELVITPIPQSQEDAQLQEDSRVFVGDMRERIEKARMSYESASFTGRQNVMDALDAWLTDPEVRIGALLAPAGYGKSVLVANWIKKLNRDQVNVVYCPISRRFGTDRAGDVAFELVQQIRRVAGHTGPNAAHEVAEDTGGVSGHSPLHQWLKQSYEKPLLVVLDGLNELSTSPHGQLLPSSIRAGVHLLVTYNGGSEEAQELRERFGWGKVQVQEFALEKLTQHEIEDVLTHSDLECNSAARTLLSNHLYRLSESGDPFLVGLWFQSAKRNLGRELREDKCIDESDIHQLRLEQYDPGIQSYINKAVAHLRNELETYQNEFDALCMAYGPLYEWDLRNGLRLDVEQMRKIADASANLIVVDRARIVVNKAQSDGRKPIPQYKFSVSHERIRTEYRSQLLNTTQHEWAKKFRAYGAAVLRKANESVQRGQQVQASPYILSHYADHLCFDEPKAAHQLQDLISEGWMRAHFNTFGNHQGFLEDVQKAWAYAEEEGVKEASSNRPVSTLSKQIACALCTASLRSLGENMPPALPALLVKLKEWSPHTALFYVAQIDDPVARLRARLALLHWSEHQPLFAAQQKNNLVDDALDDLRAIPADTTDLHEIKGHLSLQVYGFLTQPKSIERAVEQVQDFQSCDWRVRLLSDLLGRSQEPQAQRELLQRILAECTELRLPDHGEQMLPFVLDTLAQNMPMDLFKTIFDCAAPANDQTPKHYFDLLCALAPHIPSDRADAFLDICLSAGEWPYPDRRAYIVTVLAGNLTQEAINEAVQFLSDKNSDFQEQNFWRITSRGVTALLVLSYYCQDERLKCYIQEYVTPHIASDATLQALRDRAFGRCSDQEFAALIEQNEVKLDKPEFWPLYVLMGPQSMRVISKRVLSNCFAQQYVETSPHYLSHVATQLTDNDLSYFLTLINEEAHWGALKAIGSLGERLSDEQIVNFGEYTVNASFNPIDYILSAIQALAQQIPQELWDLLIRRHAARSAWHNWGDWFLLETVFRYVPQKTITKLLQELKTLYQDKQDIETAQYLVALSLHAPLAEAQRVHYLVSPHSSQTPDLRHQFKVIEALRLRSSNSGHRWQRMLREQAHREISQPFLTQNHRYALRFLPIWERIRILNHWYSENELRAGNLDDFKNSMRALAHGTIDSVDMRHTLWLCHLLGQAAFRLPALCLRYLGNLPLHLSKVLATTFKTHTSPKKYRSAEDSYIFDPDVNEDLEWRLAYYILSQQTESAKASPVRYTSPLENRWNWFTDVDSTHENAPKRLPWTKRLRQKYWRLSSRLKEACWNMLEGSLVWASDQPNLDRITLWIVRLHSSRKIRQIRQIPPPGEKVRIPQADPALADISNADISQQKEAIETVFSNALSLNNIICFRLAIKLALYERGQQLWQGLPDNRFELALEIATQGSKPDEVGSRLLLLLPALARQRPDLLSQFEKSIERIRHCRVQAMLCTSLSAYVAEERQSKLIEDALCLANRYAEVEPKQAELYSGLILGEVMEYISDSSSTGLSVSFVAEGLAKHHRSQSLGGRNCPYESILYRLVHRSGADMELLKTLWPLIQKLNESQLNHLIVIIAPHLDQEFLQKFLVLLIQQTQQERLNLAAVCLQDRWSELRREEGHDIWMHVLRAASRQPRRRLLDWLVPFSKNLVTLGSKDQLRKTGRHILDISHWRWM